MVLSGPGKFALQLQRDHNCQMIDWASLSASEPSWLKAWWRDELVEHVHIGPYGSPHTWWQGNALMGRHGLEPNGVLRIELGPGTKLRIEGDIEEVNHGNV